MATYNIIMVAIAVAKKVCRDWEWTWQEINEKEWEELLVTLD